jgi:hypothetical protein
MFGEIAATAISRFTVPVLYYWFLANSRSQELQVNEITEKIHNS